MIRIAVHLGKGGAGKSTSCWALARFFCRQARVLAVDLDPQATLTSAIVPDAPRGVYDVLTGVVKVEEAMMPASTAYSGQLQVLAACKALANLEQETAVDLDRHYLLGDSVEKFGAGADLAIIDTPPGGGSVLSVNALVAATHVLTPVTLEPAAFEQIPTTLRLIDQVRRRLNPGIKWLGILPTRFDRRRNLEALQGSGGVGHPPVPESVRVKEAMGRGESAIILASLFEPTIESIIQEVRL
jgi:chromosome partitioning protein